MMYVEDALVKKENKSDNINSALSDMMSLGLLLL